jgi:hypothetical protein
MTMLWKQRIMSAELALQASHEHLIGVSARDLA